MARGRRHGRRFGVDLGPLLPAVRRARRPAFRGLVACWRPWPAIRSTPCSAPWSPATRTATRSSWPTWRGPSTTSLGGRVILGIGAGWFQRDYDEYGYEFGTGLDQVASLGGRDPADQRHGLSKLNPPPLGPMPLLIGGSGEKVTLRIVAEHADMWNGFGPPENYAKKNAILTEWCQKVGRDPAAVERTVLIATGGSERPRRVPGGRRPASDRQADRALRPDPGADAARRPGLSATRGRRRTLSSRRWRTRPRPG